MAERVDMSPEAVLRRLREVAQLYRLGKALAQARLLGPVDDDAPDTEAPSEPPAGERNA